MNNILEAILGFCAAAIFIGAVSVLSPERNMSRPTKYVISLVFIVVSVSLFSVFGKAQIPTVNSNVSPDVQANDMLVYQTEYLCAALLRDNGIAAEKILVNTNIGSDGDIYISKITVYSNEDSQRIVQVVKSAFVTERVEVING